MSLRPIFSGTEVFLDFDLGIGFGALSLLHLNGPEFKKLLV